MFIDFISGVVKILKRTKNSDKRVLNEEFIKRKNTKGQSINLNVLKKYEEYMTVDQNFHSLMNVRQGNPLLQKIKLCEYSQQFTLLIYFSLLFSYCETKWFFEEG